MNNLEKIYSGKVRDVYRLGQNHLLMQATDRLSAFDKPVGNMPGKGLLLNKMSGIWFRNTDHIIDNHLIEAEKDWFLVKRCRPFKIEVIVRAFITGSMWRAYEKGERVFCGVKLEENLFKNQKLPGGAIITPTTKGEVDLPISKEEIVSQGLMSQKECDFVFKKALQLFHFGQEIAESMGLLLVDTKYEFGKTAEGKIVLIDEVHTCDSSRYWVRETYGKYFAMGKEPTKLDKDCVRDWIISVCNPNIDKIPPVPEDILEKTYNSYREFYEKLETAMMEFRRENQTKNIVVIVAGSDKDNTHVEKLNDAIRERNLQSLVYSHVSSAHKNTEDVLGLIRFYDHRAIERKVKLMWVTVAGRSNALSGVVAANSCNPVIACPPFSDKVDMMVNLHSSLQCPSNVPVMTILEPVNVAESIKRIFRN